MFLGEEVPHSVHFELQNFALAIFYIFISYLIRSPLRSGRTGEAERELKAPLYTKSLIHTIFQVEPASRRLPVFLVGLLGDEKRKAEETNEKKHLLDELRTALRIRHETRSLLFYTVIVVCSSVH